MRSRQALMWQTMGDKPHKQEPHMTDQTIRFDDGAAYERFMGVWSQLAGAAFLDWLAPPLGESWLDVGCGNGAFSEMIVQRLAPTAVDGIDPSEAQIAFAQARAGTRMVSFRQGDAMALSYANASFDHALMALVIFFVPVPATGVAEMVRVTRPGGSVSAYAWDIPGGGFPYAHLWDALREQGKTPLLPPQAAVSSREALHGLWAGAGLLDVETTSITVQRTFTDFDDLWATTLMGPIVAPTLAGMSPTQVLAIQDYLRARLPTNAQGQIVYTARANAVKGVVAWLQNQSAGTRKSAE